jgi:hypothetical protein
MMSERLGQRGIADLYASPHFRRLFNTPLKHERLAHSSLSERLSEVEPEYFKKMYEEILNRYSNLYPAPRIGGMKLQRVDSSLVSEASNRLEEGLSWDNNKKRGQMLKYTINYDGMYGSFAKIHSENRYANESLALPENVLDHFKKSKEHADVYIFDRGQSSAEAFDRMRSTEALPFIGRLVANKKPHVPKEFDLTFKRFDGGVLKQDASVQIYGCEKYTDKDGKERRREFLSKEKYRVIRFHPTDGKEDILLITNMFSVRAELVASMYRRREKNVKH